MKLRAVFVPALMVLSASLLLVGCKAEGEVGMETGRDGDVQTASHASGAVAAPIRQINRELLAGVPEPVAASFQRAHPDASVTSVGILDAGGGTMLYEIDYYTRDGLLEDSVYRATGEVVPRRPLSDDSAIVGGAGAGVAPDRPTAVGEPRPAGSRDPASIGPPADATAPPPPAPDLEQTPAVVPPPSAVPSATAPSR